MCYRVRRGRCLQYRQEREGTRAMRLAALMVVTAGWSMAAAGAGPGIDDPGFEEGLARWSVVGCPRERFSVEPVGMNGGNALVVPAGPGTVRGGGRAFRIEAGSRYRVSAWMKSDESAGALHIINQGWTWSSPPLKPKPGTGWRRYEARFKAEKSKDGSYQIVIRPPKTGRMWVDNISITNDEAPAGGASGPLRIPKVETPPGVDGSAGDAAWKGVAWESGFRQLKKPDLLARTQTRVKLCHDGARLYALVEADEPQTGKLVRRSSNRRDGAIWQDDSIEFHVDPGARELNYYQFVVNWKGAVFDGLGEDDNRGRSFCGRPGTRTSKPPRASRPQCGAWSSASRSRPSA